MSKLLAEWFWTDRWLGSSARALAIEPRGLYREMLTMAWRREGRLPSDPEAIRRLVACTTQEWKRCWPLIERYWRRDGNDLVNDTQLAVLEEAKAAQRRASERGRKGGKASAASRRDSPSDESTQVELELNSSSTQRPTQVPDGGQHSGQHASKPPSPSPKVSLLKPTARPARARGAGHHGLMAGTLTLDHDGHLACGPVCMKPPIVQKYIGRFNHDHARLKVWAQAVCERWAQRIDAGASVPFGDDFAFWAAAYDEDFGAAAQRSAATSVPTSEATDRYLADLRKARG